MSISVRLLWENPCRGHSVTDWWSYPHPWGSMEIPLGYLKYHRIQGLLLYAPKLKGKKKKLLDSIQTKQNQVKTKTHWFCSNELRLISWGLGLLKRVLPKSKGYRTRTLECYTLRTLETWIQSSPIQVKNLEPRGAATFPKLHSTSMQSWAQRSGLPCPGQSSFFDHMSVSVVQSWTSGILAFVSPFH